MANTPVTAQSRVLALAVRTIEAVRAFNAAHPTEHNTFAGGPRAGQPYACIRGAKVSKAGNAYLPEMRLSEGMKATWPEVFAATFPEGVTGIDGKAHKGADAAWACLARLVQDGELVAPRDGSKYFLPKDRPDLDATADGPVSVKAAAITPEDKAAALRKLLAA